MKKNTLMLKRMVVPLPIGQDVPVPRGLKIIAASQLISRTGNRYAGAIQHMSINHGRGHVSMPQQLLHCPNIIARLEQMRCERVSERMAVNPLTDIGPSGGGPDCLLQRGFVNVVPANSATTRISGQPGRSEYVLPLPFPSGIRKLACQAGWQIGFSLTQRYILEMQSLTYFEL
jgi:hypothetical protein